jgi:hypothetical protein
MRLYSTYEEGVLHKPPLGSAQPKSPLPSKTRHWPVQTRSLEAVSCTVQSTPRTVCKTETLFFVAILATSQMGQGQGVDWMWFTFGLGIQELDE